MIMVLSRVLGNQHDNCPLQVKILDNTAALKLDRLTLGEQKSDSASEWPGAPSVFVKNLYICIESRTFFSSLSLDLALSLSLSLSPDSRFKVFQT